MKKKQITLEKNENSIQIKYKSSSNSSQLQLYKQMHFNGTIDSHVLNTIKVSKENYDILRGTSLILYNADNNNFIDVVATPSDIKSDEIKATNYIREMLNINDEDKLFIFKNTTYCFNEIKIQRIDHIKEDNIVISNKDINGNIVNLDKFAFFQFYNYYTGETIIVKKSHIHINEQLANGTILLNRKQRTFLGVELPKHIPKYFWNEITSKIPQSNIENLDLLKQAYPTSDYFLKENLDYEVKLKVKALIKKYCGQRICLAPAIESYCQKVHRGFKVLSDFYVGKSTISLLCRRPYENDEGSDIVRITAANMNLLGVSEMDKVIIKYKNKSVKCRVLELEDEKTFLDSNIPTSIHNAIGIPVHIRKKLGLCNVNTAVKVDRDTTFIFKKSINEQIVPVLLTIFSINLFTDPKIWIKVLISLLSIPIIVYLNLSSKRNMRG